MVKMEWEYIKIIPYTKSYIARVALNGGTIFDCKGGDTPQEAIDRTMKELKRMEIHPDTIPNPEH